MSEPEQYTLTQRQVAVRDGIADRIVVLAGSGKLKFRAIRWLPSIFLQFQPVEVEQTIRTTAYAKAMTTLGAMGVSATVYGRRVDTFGEAGGEDPDVVVRGTGTAMPPVPGSNEVFITLVRAHTPDLTIQNGTLAQI